MVATISLITLIICCNSVYIASNKISKQSIDLKMHYVTEFVFFCSAFRWSTEEVTRKLQTGGPMESSWSVNLPMGCDIYTSKFRK